MSESMRNLLFILLAGVVGGLVVLFGSKAVPTFSDPGPIVEFAPSKFTKLQDDLPGLDFTYAAEQSIPRVVHIRALSLVNRGGRSTDFFNDFFGNRRRRGGEREQRRQGSGSGVIISPEGYIVTNNHVIEEAEEIEVQLHDNRIYKAKLIGTDPNTDIALIKINEADLSYMLFADSDEVKVGEWVLAVGNPFSLASTVTAGIVSAKGRSINIIGGDAPIESFIQTDAAVNPGNSGGALVNLNGELIGINTAIATPNGVYAGYSFAVPSEIVAKIVEDLKSFGVVQRAYLGVLIRGLNGNMAETLGLDLTEGVYIDSVMNNSAAGDAGIVRGDVILKVDEVEVKNSPELLEQIGRHRPGDEVVLTLSRDGEIVTKTVKLKNQSGNTRIVERKRPSVLEELGAEFESLDEEKAEELGLSGGVVVKRINAGKLREETDMEEGFIITHIDKEKIRNLEDLRDIVKKKGDNEGVMLEGIYEGSSRKYFYAFGM